MADNTKVTLSSTFVERFKLRAAEAGFELCGVATLDGNHSPLPELDYFPDWVARGHAGEMEYLKSRNDEGKLKRAALANAAPWAKSVIVCAVNYNTDQPHSTEIKDTTRGWISRYSWFKQQSSAKHTDYHDAVLARLRRLEAAIIEEWKEQRPQSPIQTRCYVDTGPLVERVYAKYAGIGWIGKNTCVINQKVGSWTFLGAILTSIDFHSEQTQGHLPIPAADRCGTCTRCIDACPTDALIEPYKMDARRCIAYLTIEKRGAIPEDLRPGMGNHIFGCDICQDVCPWNRKQSSFTTADEFQAREELVAPNLEWLANMSKEDFNQTFRGSPIKRAKYEDLRRNTAIAMGNSGNPEFIPRLQKLAQDPDENIAEHARWALQKLASPADTLTR